MKNIQHNAGSCFTGGNKLFSNICTVLNLNVNVKWFKFYVLNSCRAEEPNQVYMCYQEVFLLGMSLLSTKSFVQDEIHEYFKCSCTFFSFK